ncbi:MAG: sulfatase-like hydrolase/transferase [Armatimonadota bacterium]|jgi:arylsulfatase A-like enzyme
MSRKRQLNRRQFLSAASAAGMSLTGSALGQADGRKPNIVIILSDDQGYADASCYDHPRHVSTPGIDRLAAEGVRLTDGYASAWVCAPTRAGLVTGRCQQRFGFYTASDSRTGMPLSEITLADILKQHGYATGVIGKWHLGIEPEYHPLRRGFDEFYGFLGHGGHDYFDLSITDSYTSIYRNEEPISDTGYLTDNLTREAVSFIERHSKRPFLLYLPYNAVHWPLQAPEEDIERFDTGDPERDVYLAMLTRMDDGIGKVLDALRRAGVDDDTLVFFFSDNGGAQKNHADNGVLRGYKQQAYEGGVRVPFIARWTGKLPAGAVCSEPIICQDIMPTALAAAGIDLPGDRIYDGRDMLPALRGEAKAPLHEALFWDGGEGQWGVRAGKWKLVYRAEALELYDLEADTGETNDLAGAHPPVLDRLKRTYTAWKKQMAPRITRVRRRQQ